MTLCLFCEPTKEYIKSRKESIRNVMKTLNAMDKQEEYFCMEMRLKEVEKIENLMYGGEKFVPEGDK